jgi:hypothetical protein
MNKSNKELLKWLDSLPQDKFEEWVNTASIEEVDIALAYYEKRQHQRIEAELKKYEAQAREVIKKAMRK